MVVFLTHIFFWSRFSFFKTILLPRTAFFIAISFVLPAFEMSRLAWVFLPFSPHPPPSRIVVPWMVTLCLTKMFDTCPPSVPARFFPSSELFCPPPPPLPASPGLGRLQICTQVFFVVYLLPASCAFHRVPFPQRFPPGLVPMRLSHTPFLFPL